MRKIQILAVTLGMMFTAACDNGTSTEQTQKVNEAAVAPASIVETQAMDAQEFVTKAAEGGMFEVEAAKVAQQKASSKDVKDFAMMMQKDHSKSNEELMKLAKTKNLTVPTSMGESKMKMITELKKEKGAAFDKAYMQHMVMDHKEDTEMFQKASKELKDPELKSWAAKTLTTLQMHSQKATMINDKLQTTSSTENMKNKSQMESSDKMNKSKSGM